MTDTWPSEYTIRTSINWVEQVPRPKGGDCHPALLERRQEQWDAASVRHKTISERADAIRARREIEAQEQRDATAAKDAEREQKRRSDEASWRRCSGSGSSSPVASRANGTRRRRKS